MTANIIPFPKGKGKNPPQSLSEILNTVEEIQNEHIEMILEGMMEFICYKLNDEGFSLQNEKCVVPIAYVAEAIKASMLASNNRDHPLHDEAIKYFQNK